MIDARRAPQVSSGVRQQQPTFSQFIPDVLTLRLVEYEANSPDKGDYLEWEASLAVDGFAGRTRFWIARRGFDIFLAELATVDRTLRDRAELRCGWGDVANFTFGLEPYGNSGRLRVRVELRADAHGEPSDGSHQVNAAFVIRPPALGAFRASLEELIASRVMGAAALASSREAAV